MSAVEETPELQAELSDVMHLVAELATVPAMGRRGRQILFALAAAAQDADRFEGLVVDGETYAARSHSEFAVCRCGDGQHEPRRDAPEGRGTWYYRRAQADTELKRARQQWADWDSEHRPEPHLVIHLVASTRTEQVR